MIKTEREWKAVKGTEVPWVAALDSGPDERPIREQLVAHATVMSEYFQELQAAFGIPRSAGIEPGP